MGAKKAQKNNRLKKDLLKIPLYCDDGGATRI